MPNLENIFQNSLIYHVNFFVLKKINFLIFLFFSRIFFLITLLFFDNSAFSKISKKSLKKNIYFVEEDNFLFHPPFGLWSIKESKVSNILFLQLA
jgi:hypothetical protein